MKITAASVGVVALGGLGVMKLMPGPTSPPVQRDLRLQSNLRSFLEKTLDRQGVTGIQGWVAQATESQLTHFSAWVCETHKSVLYADVVGLIGDSRSAVRHEAVANLISLPPATLTPHKAAIQAIVQTAGFDPALAPAANVLLASIP